MRSEVQGLRSEDGRPPFRPRIQNNNEVLDNGHEVRSASQRNVTIMRRALDPRHLWPDFTNSLGAQASFSPYDVRNRLGRLFAALAGRLGRRLSFRQPQTVRLHG